MTESKKSTHGGGGRGQGRKPVVPGEKLVPLNVSVTLSQREKFREHLGAAWLRQQIDAAKVKPSKS